MRNSTPLFKLLIIGLITLISQQYTYAQCFGGMISDDRGQVQVYTCTSDENPDLINFSTTGSIGTTSYAYVITNADNEIISIAEGSSQDFEPAGIGTCLVWGFAYTGDIIASVGESVFSTRFSTGCWQISSNRIEVIRNEAPQGGLVFSTSGLTTVNLCLNDGIPDFVGFTSTGSNFAQYDFIITDENNNILDIVQEGFANFENAGVGVCRVWGVAYTGTLNAPQGLDLTSLILSDDCFSLSANFVEVNRSTVDGGLVSTTNGENYLSFCTDDDEDDLLNFQNTSQASGDYVYIVADEQNRLISILDGDELNVEGVPEGTCRVWGFSYSGVILLEEGQVIWDSPFSDGCFKISTTAVTIVRTSCSDPNPGCNADGGTISAASPTLELCEGQEETQSVNITLTGADGETSLWVLANAADDTFIAFFQSVPLNLSAIPAGAYTLFHIAVDGELSGFSIGGTVADLEGCFDVSNSITINIDAIENCGDICETLVDGATIFGPSEGDEIDACFSFLEEEITLEFFNTSNADASYAFAITNDQNEIMSFGVQGGQLTFTLTDEMPETVRVWGISYTGILQASLSADITTTQLSSECFSLSANFISVNKLLLNAGFNTDENDQTFIVLPGNQTVSLPINRQFDILNGADYRYLLLEKDLMDTANIAKSLVLEILEPDETNTITISPIEPNPFKAYLLFGLAYTGELLIEEGITVEDAIFPDFMFSTGCYDLADNIIALTVVDPSESPERVATVSKNDLNINVYPNPAQDIAQIQIYSNQDYANTQLEIYDLNGRLVSNQSTEIITGYNNFNINVQQLDRGMYLILLTTPEFKVHKKLVKH